VGQVGTSFAFSKESGLAADVKQFVLRKVLDGDLSVYTDPVASPTGFPFKVPCACRCPRWCATVAHGYGAGA
jgi:hypothetical protein